MGCCKSKAVEDVKVDDRVGYTYTESDGESDREVEERDNLIVSENDIGAVELYITAIDARGYGNGVEEEGAPIQAQLYVNKGKQGGGRESDGGGRGRGGGSSWTLHSRKEAQPAPCGRLYTNYNSPMRPLLKEKVRYRAPAFTFPAGITASTPCQLRMVGMKGEGGGGEHDDAKSTASGAERRSNTSAMIGAAQFTLAEVMKSRGRTARLDLSVPNKQGSMEGRTRRVGAVKIRITPKAISRDGAARTRRAAGMLVFGELLKGGDLGSGLDGPGKGMVYDASVEGGVRRVATRDFKGRDVWSVESQKDPDRGPGGSRGNMSMGSGMGSPHSSDPYSPSPGGSRHGLGGLGKRSASTNNLRDFNQSRGRGNMGGKGPRKSGDFSSALAARQAGSKYMVPRSPGTPAHMARTPPHLARMSAEGAEQANMKRFAGVGVAERDPHSNATGLRASRTLGKGQMGRPRAAPGPPRRASSELR